MNALSIILIILIVLLVFLVLASGYTYMYGGLGKGLQLNKCPDSDAMIISRPGTYYGGACDLLSGKAELCGNGNKLYQCPGIEASICAKEGDYKKACDALVPPQCNVQGEHGTCTSGIVKGTNKRFCVGGNLMCGVNDHSDKQDCSDAMQYAAKNIKCDDGYNAGVVSDNHGHCMYTCKN